MAKSSVPNVKKIPKKPKVKKKSPTLLVNIAFIALLTAAILVNQKWTNKYEQIPTKFKNKDIYIINYINSLFFISCNL